MKDLNIITIIGRLTRDAEVKYAANGTQVLQMTVANNYPVKNNQGQWENKANFFVVKFFDNNALNAYLIKGKQLAITGELRQETWKDKVEKNQSRTIIIADKIQLLSQDVNNNTSNKLSSNYLQYQTQYQPKQPELPINSNDFSDFDIYDNDIPF